MGDVIVTDAKTIPAASDNEILVVEQYPGIPKPTNRLASGIYYSFKKVWYNFSKYLVPNSRTITINGDTKDLSENRDWTIDTGAIDSVADTNTVNLTIDANKELTADVKYQDTSTVNLSEDALGLKAEFASMNISQFTNDSNYITEADVAFAPVGLWEGTATITGTVALTAFSGAAILIVGGTYSVGDNVYFEATATRNTGGANVVDIRVYNNTSNTLAGANSIANFQAGTAHQMPNLTRRNINIDSATVTYYVTNNIATDNPQNNTTVTLGTINIDWTIDQYLIPAGILTNSGDSITLQRFKVYK